MFFSLFSGVPTQWTESDRQKSQTGTGASTDRSSGNGRWSDGYMKLRKRAFGTKKSFNSVFFKADPRMSCIFSQNIVVLLRTQGDKGISLDKR